MHSPTGVFAFTAIGSPVDAPNGIITFTPSAAQTAVPGAYVYETKVTFGGGAIQTFPGSSYNEIVIDPAVPAA